MTKLLQTYKLYGTENMAMVNPSGNRLKLDIRNRDFEVKRMSDQINELSNFYSVHPEDLTISVFGSDRSINHILKKSKLPVKNQLNLKRLNYTNQKLRGSKDKLIHSDREILASSRTKKQRTHRAKRERDKTPQEKI